MTKLFILKNYFSKFVFLYTISIKNFFKKLMNKSNLNNNNNNFIYNS